MFWWASVSAGNVIIGICLVWMSFSHSNYAADKNMKKIKEVIVHLFRNVLRLVLRVLYKIFLDVFFFCKRGLTQ